MTPLRVVVVGGGSWGSVFAALLAERGHEVTLACRDAEQARAIAETGRNPRYILDADLSGIAATALEDAPVADAELVVLAVPSRSFREIADSLAGDAPVLSLTKGLDPETGSRLSDVVQGRPVAVLSGPNHAEEIAQGLPAAAVISSADEELAVRLQHAIISTRFRVYVNSDLVGVELAAAAKNVMALAAGGVDGFGFGDNAKSALITRGPLGDGAARGRVRRAGRDVLGSRRDGRPDRHVLQPLQPQPPGRRADRPGADGRRGPGGDRDGGRRAHDGLPSCGSSRTGSASSCPSRTRSARCSAERVPSTWSQG